MSNANDAMIARMRVVNLTHTHKPRSSVKFAVLVPSPELHQVRGLFSEIANSADLCAQTSALYVRQVERAADRLEAQAAKLRALVADPAPFTCDGHGSDLINGVCPDCVVESQDFDDSDELGLAEFDREQLS